MANDIKYIEIVTWNRKMMLLHGDKLTGIQKAIGRRSNGLHVEIRFSDRYGRISWSCTKADGANGCRFKMIDYSHPYRQSVVRIYVTAEQEARLFAKACEMADMGIYDMIIKIRLGKELVNINSCYYGPNHIKYDTWGASFGFITKYNIWKMHRTKMICNEACAEVLLVEWPGLLDVPVMEFENYKKRKDPATLTPDQFEYLVRHYFEANGDIT